MTNETNDGQKVVSLMGMLEENRFSAIAELETYWNELRGNRAVPLRSEVDPRKIENCLEYAFIVERIAPGLARFRLAGNHLSELIGMEVRGMPLTSIFAADARTVVSEALESVFSGPSAVTLSLNAVSGLNKPPMEGRMVLLPLKSDFGDVTRALGVLVTHGKIGSTPRRFTCGNTMINTVAGELPAKPHTAPVATDRPKVVTQPKAPVAGFNESATVFQGKASEPKTVKDGKVRPHLYLVSSNT